MWCIVVGYVPIFWRNILNLKMEAAFFSEMSVDIYQIAWYHVPEPQISQDELLKS
jgi:hypothetical protein